MSEREDALVNPNLPFKLGKPSDADAAALIAFFERKGVRQLKEEDAKAAFHEDFLKFLKETRLYAKFLSRSDVSSLGAVFDLRKICTMLEYFAFWSPAHAYSFQVSFLGIFPFLMSKNKAARTDAVRALESGELFAFGLSERHHGSDIYSSKTSLLQEGAKTLVSGKKYYIGNANCAGRMSVLAVDRRGNLEESLKENFVFFAYRPRETSSFKDLVKIPTLGVRTAFVGGFTIDRHELGEHDVLSRGSDAWDAVFGTVNLGKFFLGFGSLGICEHAMAEALAHVRSRILFGKPVYSMPHIRKSMARAFVRLAAMKLYAFRALDYAQGAREDDRRYLLTNSVQKAKVSLEGVEVMKLLSECMGAKGFEADTYFEGALRDITLIPGLEGSTHINYGLTNLFLKKYFFGPKDIASLPHFGQGAENPYLFEAKTGGLSKIEFPEWDLAYKPFSGIESVDIFSAQVGAFKGALIARGAGDFVSERLSGKSDPDAELVMETGKLFCTIVYGQLVAERAAYLKLDSRVVSAIFATLSQDLSERAVRLMGLSAVGAVERVALTRCVRSCVMKNEDLERASELLELGF